MPDANDSSQKLIQLYNEVDAFMRQRYGQDKYSDHTFLIHELAANNRTIARYQQEMRAVAQLRNSLVHNPFARIDGPIAYPNPDVVKRYESIRDLLLHPIDALSIAIPTQKIYTATLSSNLAVLLKTMNKNIYTHVPIIEDDKLVGIFSENVLLSFLADSGEAIITKDMTIAEFAEYIPVRSHAGESFVFLPRQARLSKLFEVFNKAIHRHERIGMVFITEHGKESEKPLGIITAWDLASPDFELG